MSLLVLKAMYLLSAFKILPLQQDHQHCPTVYPDITL